MTTDFRALCAELLSALENEGYAHWICTPDEDELCLCARAALAEPEPEGPTLDDIWNLCERYEFVLGSDGSNEEESVNVLWEIARAVLARWGRPAPQPADGEVAELAAWLRGANWDRQRQTLATRAASLLERLSPPQPVPVAERLPMHIEQALIKAECALSDIAEGEAEESEGDPLEWAEKRAADALARIRPVMRQHQIQTSEWPPLPAHALPVPNHD